MAIRAVSLSALGCFRSLPPLLEARTQKNYRKSAHKTSGTGKENTAINIGTSFSELIWLLGAPGGWVVLQKIAPEAGQR
jgi:hypothetical protein